MSFPAVLAQLHYNAARLHELPAAAPTRAERKALRELLTSTLDTLAQLSAHVLARPQPRPAPLKPSLCARAEQTLRRLEHQFLALSPGQDAPLVLWALLRQTLYTVLAELNATYRLA